MPWSLITTVSMSPPRKPDRDVELRAAVTRLLRDRLETQTEPFPETEHEFADLLAELADTPALRDKLIIAGVVDRPYGPDRRRCTECMYFLVHRSWCDVPELAIPVEPNWWCRLWRI